MKIIIQYAFIVLIFGYTSCTKNVRQVSSFSEPSDLNDLGFVGYTLEKSEGYKVYLTVQKVESGQNFKILLNNIRRDKKKIYLGPWKVFDSDTNNELSNDVMITPLKPGNYKIKYFHMRVENSKNSNSNNYMAAGNSFKIFKDKVTYIGSYTLDSKHLLPWKRNIKTQDLSKKYLSIYDPDTYSIQITKVSK